MSEWHLTPEYINHRWTEELLVLMFMKRTKWIERNRPTKGPMADVNDAACEVVPDHELFNRMGLAPDVVEIKQ